MKKYIVLLSNKKRGTLQEELLLKHVDHLKALKEEGILFLCGPFQDNDGALQILLASTKEEVEKRVLEDPFIQYAYYQTYTISELIEANEENNYLMEDTQTIINKKRV